MKKKENKIQNKRPPIKPARKIALQEALRKNLSRRKESKNDQN